MSQMRQMSQKVSPYELISEQIAELNELRK